MSEDAHNSDNQFGSRAWSNGELCPAHGIPYCSPCLRTQLGTGAHNEPETRDDIMERMRNEVVRRIREGEMHHAGFHRPAQRNFFNDSRRRQFAATCQLGEGNHLFIPLSFVIVNDDSSAWKATDEETSAILHAEYQWDSAMPAWAQNFVPDISDEDAMLLREMQLFK